MPKQFRIGESVRTKINGPGTVVSVGFNEGDAVMVKFPDGKQQAFTPNELERIPPAASAEQENKPTK